MEFTGKKNKAIYYRKKGFSYGLISTKTGVSKSTLSDWLKEIPYNPNKETIKRIGSARLKSAQKKSLARVENIKEMKDLATKDIGKLDKRDVFMLGLGLYWGEGNKSYNHTRVVNSDPDIIISSIKWFKEICGLNNKNFTISLALYPDSDINKCLNFWSKKTGIPIKNFRKTQVDKRKDKSPKKRGKLPYGTAHLHIIANGEKKFGVELHRRIIGWIEAVSKQIKMRE
jgi:transcriptional regulator with XRE-family HTH domain